MINTLHQIWIGDKQMPSEWMQTWRDKNPSMSYNIWREKDIDSFGLRNRDKYDYYYSKGIFDGAADIARVEILEALGGVYIDADSICLEPIEGEWFMNQDFFAAFEYDDRVANGVIGSVPHHMILVEYLKRIARATVLEPACYTIGGTMFTSSIDFCVYNSKVSGVILPTNNFYPKWKHRGEIKEKIYARQMWGSTKGLYK